MSPPQDLAEQWFWRQINMGAPTGGETETAEEQESCEQGGRPGARVGARPEEGGGVERQGQQITGPSFPIPSRCLLPSGRPCRGLLHVSDVGRSSSLDTSSILTVLETIDCALEILRHYEEENEDDISLLQQ
jgi:hypothetical protein